MTKRDYDTVSKGRGKGWIFCKDFSLLFDAEPFYYLIRVFEKNSPCGKVFRRMK